jgi:hypothetical protein
MVRTTYLHGCSSTILSLLFKHDFMMGTREAHPCFQQSISSCF